MVSVAGDSVAAPEKPAEWLMPLLAYEDVQADEDMQAELHLYIHYCEEINSLLASFDAPPFRMVADIDFTKWTDPVFLAALASGPEDAGQVVDLLQQEDKRHLICEPLLWKALAPSQTTGSNGKAPPSWCPGSFTQYTQIMRAWKEQGKLRNPLMHEFLAFWSSHVVAPEVVAAESNHTEAVERTMEEHRITRDEIKSHLAAELDKRLGAHVPGESADAVVKRLELQLGAAKCLRSQEREETKETKAQAAQAKRAQKEKQEPRKRARQ